MKKNTVNTYGYCRISKPSQKIERQIKNISEAYPDAVIIKEAYTGTKMVRPEWNKLEKRLKEGDTVVFDSISRFSRSSEEGVSKYFELYNRGVNLVFLKEPTINTANYRDSVRSVELTGDDVDLILEGVNKYLMALAKKQIVIAFDQAQKEVDDLHQRTKEGIQVAREAGKQIGRAPGTKYETKTARETKKIIRDYSKTFGGYLSDLDCIKIAGCSRNSYYKYKRELVQEMEEAE